MHSQIQRIRTQIYNLIINSFEPFLREYIKNYVLLIGGKDHEWRKRCPDYVLETAIAHLKKDSFSLDEFMEVLFLSDLTSIATYEHNFAFMNDLVGTHLSQEDFRVVMDLLNETRNKVAHPGEVSVDNLEATISRIKRLCHNKDIAKRIHQYIDLHKYESGTVPPPVCIHNLQRPSYEADGGFVNRPEVGMIIEKLSKNRNRVIDIIGAGGVGKTAMAEHICHHFLNEPSNPYYAILFFSAKSEALTEEGVKEIASSLPSFDAFIDQLCRHLLGPEHKKLSIEQKEKKVLDLMDREGGGKRCLLIIDNLEKENIFRNKRIKNFITELPKDSQIILTSRIGTEDLSEERVKINPMNESHAITLLRKVARNHYMNQTNLCSLPDTELKRLVHKVYCTPLLIKWALARNVVLGMNIDVAFSTQGEGGEEAINFMLSETYSILSEKARLFLECMAVHKNSRISRAAIIEMTGFFREDNFDQTVQSIARVSLVRRETPDGREEIFIIDQMTKKYIQDKLYTNKRQQELVRKRYQALLYKIQQSQEYLGTQTIEGMYGDLKESEYLASAHILGAIQHNIKRNYSAAKDEFEVALKLAPWWYHAFVEYAYFEMHWNHLDVAEQLIDRAIELNPRCKQFKKAVSVLHKINPSEFVSLKIGQVVDLEIAETAKRGSDGVGRYGGMVVFVPDSKVGETLKVKIISIELNSQTGKKYAQGMIVNT